MWIQLIDTGEYNYIRKSCPNMYELPMEIQNVGSSAVLCNILEVDNDGISINVADYLKKLCGNRVNFQIINVKK